METSLLDATAKFIATVGVPAAIAFLVLWKLNGKMDKLVTAMNNLTTSINTITRQEQKLDEIQSSIDNIEHQFNTWEERWRARPQKNFWVSSVNPQKEQL